MAVQIQNAQLLTTWEDSMQIMPDGSAEATLVQECPWANLFNYVPQPLQPHPVFPALLYYDGEAMHKRGAIGRLISRYRGIYSLNPSALEQVEGAISTTAEPLETAPLFYGPPRAANPTGFDDQIAPLNHYDINAVNLALQNNTDPVFTGYPSPYVQGAQAYNYYLKKVTGRDSYFRVGYTWKRHYASPTVPTYTNFVGYVVTPPQTPFAPPAAPAGQNYLFTGISWRQQGGVVTVDEEYMLSGPGGWDIDLYTYPGGGDL